MYVVLCQDKDGWAFDRWKPMAGRPALPERRPPTPTGADRAARFRTISEAADFFAALSAPPSNRPAQAWPSSHRSCADGGGRSLRDWKRLERSGRRRWSSLENGNWRNPALAKHFEEAFPHHACGGHICAHMGDWDKPGAGLDDQGSFYPLLCHYDMIPFFPSDNKAVKLKYFNENFITDGSNFFL